jgi:LysM repeat protein
MRHRSLGRWLAPVALVTCAVAIYTIVQAGRSDTNGSGGGSGSTKAVATGTTTTRTAAARKRKAAAKPRTYTVQPGDVLSAIASKTGVSVVQLEALNPAVDAQTLRVGQKLRLSR